MRAPVRVDDLGGRVCTVHDEYMETRGDAVRIRNAWPLLHTGPVPRIGFCDATNSWHVSPAPSKPRRTR